jgi:hypothetical protein
MHNARRAQHACGKPMIEIGLRKKPTSGDFCTGDRAFGHHFIDFALFEPEIGGGFGGRQKLHERDPALFLYLF